MLSATSLLPADHLFTALLKTRLVEDLLFLYDEEAAVAHLVIKLGRDVCGHAQIMHGGLTSSIFDETFGALVYVMKQRALIPAALAVTANLSTNYRAPIPTQSCLLCTVKVKEITGRKIFLEGTMTHVLDRTHYADATALFINMKAPPPTAGAASAGAEDSKGSMAAGFSMPAAKQATVPVKEWHTSPRYDALCAAINIDL